MIDENKRKNPISSPIGLQIDNLVYNQHGEMVTIRPNDFHRFMQPRMNGDYGIYAIPLSPEVFERLGFKQETPDNKYGEVYRKDKFRFIIRKVDFGVFPNTDLGWAFELSDDKDWATIVSKVEYAHQIQNLYFALTGTELTYNPNQP